MLRVVAVAVVEMTAPQGRGGMVVPILLILRVVAERVVLAEEMAQRERTILMGLVMEGAEAQHYPHKVVLVVLVVLLGVVEEEVGLVVMAVVLMVG